MRLAAPSNRTNQIQAVIKSSGSADGIPVPRTWITCYRQKHDLRSLKTHDAERFREDEIPTNQNANTPEVRFENRVFIRRSFAILNFCKRKMRLPVFSRDSAIRSSLSSLIRQAKE
jgi:hypothetical protein